MSFNLFLAAIYNDDVLCAKLLLPAAPLGFSVLRFNDETTWQQSFSLFAFIVSLSLPLPLVFKINIISVEFVVED